MKKVGLAVPKGAAEGCLTICTVGGAGAAAKGVTGVRTAGTVAADIGKLKKIEDCLKVGKDIAKPVARFSKQKLGQQIQEHNNFLKTFLDHLRKYRQQPGNTVGEVNRIERQLEAYRKILESRGVLFDDLGNAIHP